MIPILSLRDKDGAPGTPDWLHEVHGQSPLQLRSIYSNRGGGMPIRRLKAWNFKNFEELDLELRDFNVLVGANAAGKSNTLELLKFVRDVAVVGLDNAISLQGGAKYFRNLKIGSGSDFRLEISTEPHQGQVGIRMIPRTQALKEGREPWQVRVDIRSAKHTLGIHFLPDGVGFEIAEDKIEMTGTFHKETMGGRDIEDCGSGVIGFFRTSEGKVELEASLPRGIPLDSLEDLSFIPKSLQLPPKRTISLELPLYLFLSTLDSYRDTEFRNIEVFDIDPKSPKFGVQIAGKADLEGDGGNLALVLKTLLENDAQKQTLSNLVRDLLPFVDDFKVEPFADRTFLFRLQEVFFPQEYLPASLLSDGTISVMALIVALYFERRLLVAFEEPERNLHPSLIAKVVAMLKDGSQSKQVIVSTHSPEVVRHCKLEDLILVSRDRSGFSKLSRPAERDSVRLFLKNEIGIEDLYLQNMLEL